MKLIRTHCRCSKLRYHLDTVNQRNNRTKIQPWQISWPVPVRKKLNNSQSVLSTVYGVSTCHQRSDPQIGEKKHAQPTCQRDKQQSWKMFSCLFSILQKDKQMWIIHIVVRKMHIVYNDIMKKTQWFDLLLHMTSVVFESSKPTMHHVVFHIIEWRNANYEHSMKSHSRFL